LSDPVAFRSSSICVRRRSEASTNGARPGDSRRPQYPSSSIVWMDSDTFVLPCFSVRLNDPRVIVPRSRLNNVISCRFSRFSAISSPIWSRRKVSNCALVRLLRSSIARRTGSDSNSRILPLAVSFHDVITRSACWIQFRIRG